MSLPECKLMQN